MAQANQKLQLIGQPAVNGAGWTAVTVPLPECRQVLVINPDIASPLLLSTDPLDLNSVLTIAAQSSQALTLSSKYVRGFLAGEIACYLQGSGAIPLVAFSV